MSFDPDQFLDITVTDANSTQVIPVPVGEYTAVIKAVKARTWTGKKDPSMTGVSLDVTWELDSPEVKALLDRDTVTVKQGVSLDMNESGTSLDMGKGKNVGLGRLREACNLNVPGKPFSFQQLIGQLAKVSVVHRVDGESIFAEVKGVARLS